MIAVIRLAIAGIVLALGLANAQAQSANYQGIWWASPPGSESGWGINLTHQGDVLFVTWFTYSSNGRGLWLVGSLFRQANGSFSGDLYTTKGPAFSSTPFNPALVTRTQVGTATITFTDATNGSFSYTVNGIAQTKAITQMLLRWLPTCQQSSIASLEVASSYGGLWWAAPAESESGWGLNLAHQGDVIFLTWFTYDTDNEPLWLVGTLEPQPGSWSGTLYRTTGPPFSSVPFDASRVTLTQVGSATLKLGYENQQDDGRTGTLSYTVNGISQSKKITQLIFRDQVTTCVTSYPIDYIRDKFRQSGVATTTDALVFASKYRLNAFHLDFLRGLAPNTTVRQIRDNKYAPLAGGANIDQFSLPFTQMIELPADPTQVKYPDDYAASRAKNLSVVDPYCNPAPSKIVWPASYLGSHALPEVKLTGDRSSFRRVAWLKDVWSKPNNNFVPGCISDPREGYKITLARLKKLNVDSIVLTPWTVFDASGSAWRVMNPAELRTSTMNDTDLEWAVAEAKRNGFKVFWSNQIQGVIGQGGGSIAPTVENVLKSYDALEPYLEERGAFLQRIGMDGVIFANAYWTSFVQVLPSGQYLDRTKRVVAKLKSKFSGLIGYAGSGPVSLDPTLPGMIDFYVTFIQLSMTQAEADGLSVAALKAKFNPLVESERNVAKGKPILWNVGPASRDDVFSTPWLEETFCTEGYELSGASAGCIQDKKVTNFGIQAMATEALFEVIFEKSPVNAFGVAANFWMDDSVMASSAFPNISNSVRGKPAESVVYQWFKR